jgi:hypothetical protein
VRTAIDGVSRLNTVAENGAPAVSASGRQGVNGALETVEDVMDGVRRFDRKRLIVVVSAGFTDSHCRSPNRQSYVPRTWSLFSLEAQIGE